MGVGIVFYVMVWEDGGLVFVVDVVVVRVHVLEFFWGDEFVMRVGGEGVVICVFGVDGFGGVNGIGGEGAMRAVVVCSIY